MTETLDQRRARFVRTLLAWHDVSRAELAELLGVSVHTVYKKLDGQRAFTTDDFLAICDIFHVSPDSLLRPPAELAELGDVSRGPSGISPASESGLSLRRSGCSYDAALAA